jgi:hypothetical protein
MSFFRYVLLSSLVLGASAACSGGNSGANAPGGGNGDGGASFDGGDGDSGSGPNGDKDGETGNPSVFDVQPSEMQTITVDPSDASPAVVTFKATLNGKPVQVGWNVDRGEVGSIQAGPASSAKFTPSATTGGLVTVRAGLAGEVLERKVFVKLSASQNGPNPDSTAEQAQVATDVPSLTAGGGIGGVGGEGLGTAVNDGAVRDLLDAPTGGSAEKNLKLLYPYDDTVFPRGILAPLLMWESDLGGVDAIKIELRTTSGSFEWSGKFAAPAILVSTGDPFIRHPIPQDAWTMATNTAGGLTPEGEPDRLEVSLTLAKGAESYGPVTRRWTVAQARLSGTIYYSSYGTNLAKNHDGAVGGDGKFGGAVLSIRVGDTGPALAAGTDGGAAQCRVCHSTSADGGRLFALSGDGYKSNAYDLSPTGVGPEQAIPKSGVEYPGLTADGRYALAHDGVLLDLDNGGAEVSTTGLSDVATDLGPASFSYDGTSVAFNPMASPMIADPRRKLVVMAFDAAAKAFSSPVTVVDNSAETNAEMRPGWPTFTPDGALVFHQQIAAGTDGNNQSALHTRKGAKAYLAWTPASEASPTPLNRLNGLDASGESYLPQLAAPIALTCTGDGTQVGGIDANHADDANLNYEPTVNPIPSGGYAWVVFTSRRMYGSVANIPPFCSDPRGVNLIDNITPKKLWVAAINLNGKPGEDISHPAFYLPAQELLAGNTRGAWVLDPCRNDGTSCETGDQCCNGYCSANGEGELVCANEPPDNQCSAPQERCEEATDCCDPANQCINGFCTVVIL